MERLLILIVIVVVVFIYKNKFYEGMDNCAKRSFYHFLHSDAANRYKDLEKEFGEPSVFVDEPQGVAIWRGDFPFEYIMLKDESVPHDEPFSHCDYLYAAIRVHIPDDIVGTVLALDRTLYYDRLKKELVSRCYFMGGNVSTLWLAMKIIENPNKASDIAKEYSNAFQASMQTVNYKQMYFELTNMVKANMLKYPEELDRKECVFNYGAGQSSSLMRR